jgi:hypothetical protein
LRSKLFRGVLVLTIVPMLLAGLGQTQEAASGGESPSPARESPAPIITITPKTITWQLDVAYTLATLVVAGPGEYWTQDTFPTGVAPFLHADGLPEGQFAYEIRISPVLSPAAQAALDAAAEEEPEVRARVVADLQAAGELPTADQTIYGSFRVQDGQFVLDTASEPDATTANGSPVAGAGTSLQDEVYDDDLIVQYNACIGVDCENGEDFGDDVLRLEENILRLDLVDTSGASYPSNDWRILIHDTGQDDEKDEYFKIQDTISGTIPFKIEPGARRNALYVEDGGNVGLGTSAPAHELHIVYGDTPMVRLDQQGNGSVAAQTWDVGGNESWFMIRDISNSSKIPFMIRPDAPTDSLFIADDGRVGLGTSSPQAQLHIRGDDASARVQKDGRVTFDLDTVGHLTIWGALSESSDVALKENLAPVDGDSILACMGQLPIRTWNYRADDDTVRHLGPTAQDFYRLFELGADDKHIASLDANGVALAELQQLARLAEAQEAQLQQLRQRNLALRQRLSALEAALEETFEAQEQKD